ncbi:hypothetical protein SAMN05880561_1102 [Rhizobium sp. RU33A]|nr:hypothetical protein SAMN05880561_1102 [Rhizobium sp. RU33A]
MSSSLYASRLHSSFGLLTLLLLLSVLAGCVQTKKLSATQGEFAGRSMSFVDNPALPMVVGNDDDVATQAALPVGLGLAVSMLDVGLKASTGMYEKAFLIPKPIVDPSEIVEQELAATLRSSYGLVRQEDLRVPLKPANPDASWPDQARVSAIVAFAKANGHSGMIVDVAMTRLSAKTHGHGLSLGGPKVQFELVVNFAIIDAASGKLVASTYCVTPPNAARHSLDTVLNGGPEFVDRAVSGIARACADRIRKNVLPAR